MLVGVTVGVLVGVGVGVGHIPPLQNPLLETDPKKVVDT